MKISVILAGALASTALAHSGHEGPSMPKLFGARKFLSNLKAMGELPEALSGHSDHKEDSEAMPKSGPSLPDLKTRQIGGTDGQCGPGVGTCSAGVCCSPAGWCGVGTDYCAGPDCQLAYGPGCDGNIPPSGASTLSIARPLLGSQPYGGAGIYDCLTPGEIAFTFDDGPYNYTSDLLDKLLAYNAKATFMITGNNLGKGPIDTHWAAVIQRMIAEGHQIASHTWSHQNLSSLNAATFQDQIIYNEMAFRNILGYFPTYMRPPYSECDATCESRLLALGYHITYFDLDTAGYLNDSPTLIQNSKNIWDAAIAQITPANGNYLEIEHDIHYQTVYNLTDYILASMYSKGFTSVTVGQCLGDPAANWYRSAGSPIPVPSSSSTATKSATSTSKGPSSTAALTISVDGSCGVTTTCQGSTYGNCCSQYGYCGSTSTYCSTGCQPGFGTCGISSSSSSTSVSSSTPKGSTSTSSKSTSGSSTSTSKGPSSTSSAPLAISTDGSCGVTTTCQGSTFGSCCSQYGYCGSTSTYCSTGCQPGFGTCGLSSSSSLTPQGSTTSSKSTSTTTKPSSSSTKTSTSSTSTATKPISTDGTCGTKFTCLGSTYGNCCSQYGYCGSTSSYCGTGCNASGGTCTKRRR